MEVLHARGLAGVADRLAGRKVAILAPPSRRFVDRVEAVLAGTGPTVFDGARVHVPAEVVDAALTEVERTGSDAIVAIGGGSPIGLGKALRLRRELAFVAIPTTYAGSEMTTMFGITTGATKHTGRDPRVRPDLVVYDVELTLDLPIALTVQSLANALAHVISVLSTASIEGDARAGGIEDGARARGIAAAATVVRAIDELIASPRALSSRELAQRGASGCAAVYDQGKPGVQHQLAHLLGGALRVDHARLHAALLPGFVAHLRTTRPELVRELEHALERAPLDSYLRDALVRAGAPVTLGASAEAVLAALATRPELPAQIALAAAGP
jgi:maleylacetate reductase